MPGVVSHERQIVSLMDVKVHLGSSSRFKFEKNIRSGFPFRSTIIDEDEHREIAPTSVAVCEKSDSTCPYTRHNVNGDRQQIGWSGFEAWNRHFLSEN